MSFLAKAYIGVGSNLGDRIQNLIDARESLRDLPQINQLECSSFYMSSPVGYLEQDNFINCVFELDLSIDHQSEPNSHAQSLFLQMQKIESHLGRVRDPNNQNAARTIDLDLLVFAAYQSDDPKLTLPHPRICERLFVLLPLLELNPDIELPNAGALSAVLDKRQSRGDFKDQLIYKLNV